MRDGFVDSAVGVNDHETAQQTEEN